MGVSPLAKVASHKLMGGEEATLPSRLRRWIVTFRRSASRIIPPAAAIAELTFGVRADEFVAVVVVSVEGESAAVRLRSSTGPGRITAPETVTTTGRSVSKLTVTVGSTKNMFKRCFRSAVTCSVVFPAMGIAPTSGKDTVPSGKITFVPVYSS